MIRNNNPTQEVDDQSSTSDEDIEDLSGATPPLRPLSKINQAFQAISENREEIKKLKSEINNPDWLKKFVKNISSIIIYIKIVILLFLSILLLSLIIFLFFSFIQLNYLLDVLEFIRDNKTMEFNDELLNSFYNFYHHSKKIIDSYFTIIGAIFLIAVLAAFFVKIWGILLPLFSKKQK